MLVGLAAAGRAGKASARFGFLPIFDDDATRAGVDEGEGRALAAADEEDAQGVWPGLAPIRPAGVGKAGKGLLDDAEDQLAC